MSVKQIIKQVVDLLRKVGIAHVSKGDYITGEFDSRRDLKAKHSDKRRRDNNPGTTDTARASTTPVHKAVFWVVAIIAAFFFLVLWGGGITLWSLLGMGMWGYFLYWLRSGAGATAMIGKVVALTFGAVVMSFFLADFSTPEDGTVPTSDKVVTADQKHESAQKASADSTDVAALKAFLAEVGAAFDQKPVPQQSPDVTWSAARVALALMDGHAIVLEDMTQDDIGALQTFFVRRGATTGGIGFEFVPPAGTISAGFVIDNEKFKQLMCVITSLEKGVIEVACGYGPGGGAQE